MHEQYKCDVCCSITDEVVSFEQFEVEMLSRRESDIGIYDPTLTKLWMSEHKSNEIVGLIENENKRYYPDQDQP